MCTRLDGLPLAIELAAATLRVLGVEQLRDRLDDRFSLLVGGSRTSPSRQQTLEATLDWSYQLLGEPEQIVFARLSVFVGGCSLEAAEAVCAGDSVAPSEILGTLTGLVDKSLVSVTEWGGAARYALPETIRQYALEKMRQTGDERVLRRRHATWCVEMLGARPGAFGAGQQLTLVRASGEGA